MEGKLLKGVNISRGYCVLQYLFYVLEIINNGKRMQKMKNFKKLGRIISMLLVVAMTVTAVPMDILAGEGTASEAIGEDTIDIDESINDAVAIENLEDDNDKLPNNNNSEVDLLAELEVDESLIDEIEINEDCEESLPKDELVYEYKTLTTTIDGIRISVDGYVPNDTELEVEELQPEENISDDYHIVATYDIRLMLHGTEYEPKDDDSSVYVTFENLNVLEGVEMQILHETNEGELEVLGEAINVLQEDDVITVETDSFSKYSVGVITSTSRMTSEGTYNVPNCAKNGTIYHMYLKRAGKEEEAFCLDLGKSASSNDTYYQYEDTKDTTMVNKVAALYFANLESAEFNFDYKTAQGMIWACEAGNCNADQLTEVIDYFGTSDKEEVLNALSNYTVMPDLYIWHNSKGGPDDGYQRFITDIGSTASGNEDDKTKPNINKITPMPDDAEDGAFYVKVFNWNGTKTLSGEDVCLKSEESSTGEVRVIYPDAVTEKGVYIFRNFFVSKEGELNAHAESVGLPESRRSGGGWEYDNPSYNVYLNGTRYKGTTIWKYTNDPSFYGSGFRHAVFTANSLSEYNPTNSLKSGKDGIFFGDNIYGDYMYFRDLDGASSPVADNCYSIHIGDGCVSDAAIIFDADWGTRFNSTDGTVKYADNIYYDDVSSGNGIVEYGGLLNGYCQLDAVVRYKEQEEVCTLNTFKLNTYITLPGPSTPYDYNYEEYKNWNLVTNRSKSSDSMNIYRSCRTRTMDQVKNDSSDQYRYVDVYFATSGENPYDPETEGTNVLTIFIKYNGGVGPVNKIYKQNNTLYWDIECTKPIMKQNLDLFKSSIPTKAGYEFVGLNSKADGSGYTILDYLLEKWAYGYKDGIYYDGINDAEMYSVHENTTWYAQWKKDIRKDFVSDEVYLKSYLFSEEYKEEIISLTQFLPNDAENLSVSVADISSAAENNICNIGINGNKLIYDVKKMDNFIGNASTTISIQISSDNYKKYTKKIRIERAPASGLWCSNIEDQIYTGKTIKPELEVYSDGVLLIEGKDYTLSYGKNNTNVASSDAKDKKGNNIAPYVTISGTGNYSEKKTVYFAIVPKSINLAIANDITVAKTGGNIKIARTVTLDGKKLVAGKEYVISTSPEAKDAITTLKDVGKYKLYAVGINNYQGYVPFSYTITDAVLASKVSIDKISDQNYAGGSEIRPSVKITYNKKDVSKCFDVSYENNAEIGIATVIISAKEGVKSTSGKEFAGTKTTTFKIKGQDISNIKLGADGKKKLPEFTYSGKVNKLEWDDLLYTKADTTLLVKDIDYTVAYSNNINAGTATAIITGIGRFSGTKKLTYKINKYDAGKDVDEQISINAGNSISVLYEKGGVSPKPVVKKGDETLIEGKDYTLSYKNNTAVADLDAKKVPTISISFKGNLCGNKSVPFIITSKNINQCNVTMADKAVSTRKNAWKQTSATITDINGKKLAAGADYNKVFRYYSNKACTDEIEVEMLPGNTTVYVKIDGIKNYEGSYVVGVYRISQYSISSATATIDSQIFTGSEIRPEADDITVTYGRNKQLLTAGEDYEIVEDSYTKNINKGTATVTIRGLGNYYGTKVVSFKIETKKFLWWKL